MGLVEGSGCGEDLREKSARLIEAPRPETRPDSHSRDVVRHVRVLHLTKQVNVGPLHQHRGQNKWQSLGSQ